MELDKLILLNQNIKRRLIPAFKGNICMFVDGRDRIVKVDSIGMPHAMMVADVEDPHKDERRIGRPYYINKDMGSRKDISGLLKLEEAALVLGVDYFSRAEPHYIHAMLEACSGGPGLSNAYVLGGNHSFSELKKPKSGHLLIVPVQFYLIPKEVFDSLALSEKEIKSLRNG